MGGGGKKRGERRGGGGGGQGERYLIGVSTLAFEPSSCYQQGCAQPGTTTKS